MRENIILSIGIFTKEGRVSVYDTEEVNIYDDSTTNIEINRKAILTGYFIKKTVVCHNLLKDKV